MTSTPPSPSVAPIVTPVSGETEYTLWAVLRKDPQAHAAGTPAIDPAAQAELRATIEQVEANGTTLRGVYDVSSIRADADVMLWLHGTSPEAIQAALRDLRRTSILRPLLPTWNAMGVHRDAEFSADHIPSFMRGKEPADWLTVYPFVRSYEWYLMDPAERRSMLGKHGRLGGAFPNVLANTVASFALGDYEWILALEADNLLELVDLMRHLRATDARMHVREEVPFYTGRRIDLSELVDVLS
ncbi:chlorite dismutase family protein [Salinibacterium sp. dk2585]|uniref:hydrogen peroxide-dependent heme synthase n=1 Tax=unclassified Salinibacterium TaxID=2632331 RepID=UPI0011C25075|nr:MULTISPECIES: hydrogen peroxide-dependent heme synthase [unclassified Salinibacterium]QEE61193.1 chlorite dismutase family protein [Salinibacterium sp. dk2585]TXK53868.1 chlorite dismutase family protein [Salinibacterium sp. dk5596]